MKSIKTCLAFGHAWQELDVCEGCVSAWIVLSALRKDRNLPWVWVTPCHGLGLDNAGIREASQQQASMHVFISALNCGCDTWRFCLDLLTLMDSNLQLSANSPLCCFSSGLFYYSHKNETTADSRRDGLCGQHSRGQLLYTVVGSEMQDCRRSTSNPNTPARCPVGPPGSASLP